MYVPEYDRTLVRRAPLSLAGTKSTSREVGDDKALGNIPSIHGPLSQWRIAIAAKMKREDDPKGNKLPRILFSKILHAHM